MTISNELFRPTFTISFKSEKDVSDTYDEIWKLIKPKATIEDFDNKKGTHTFDVVYQKSITIDEYARLKKKLKQMY